MVNFPPIAAGLALAATAAASATAPTLNPWPQYNHGGWYNQSDGDVTTYGAPEITSLEGPPVARFPFLFNAEDPVYAGLYVQSSTEDFITDYKVEAYSWRSDYADITGKVCGAKGNFTFVQLFGPDGLPNTLPTLTMFIEVTAANNNGSRAFINEVWPVWVGDDIFYPNNTSPCPAPAAKTKGWTA
ncbi:hypothetical protein SGCOL_003136 [Colletotrichum sp. CLE4]